MARVCREAGARVAENVLLQDMNLQGISAHDSRQIEVVANGLPLWHGAQLAVDATCNNQGYVSLPYQNR